MNDHPRVSLVGRLAARAVTLALDAATATEDVADHLLRLAHDDAAVLERAARQVERRHPDPESAAAQLAVRALRLASSLATTAPATDGMQDAVA